MKKLVIIVFIAFMAANVLSCAQADSPGKQTSSDPSGTGTDLAAFINKIQAVDNHAHPNTIDPDDKGSDALPLDGLGAIELPARVRPESRIWIDAAKALYGFTGNELNDQSMKELVKAEQDTLKQKGDKFPSWVLEKTALEVMIANRLYMGNSLAAPAFRWASYVDALLFPLSTKSEAAVTPDREKLYPLEDGHLKEFLADLKMSKLPATLEEYQQNVVTATLEAQKKGGCLAIKFEVAYLRSFNFDKVALHAAAKVYHDYIKGGEPSHEKYKLLQDYLFRYIAKEAGRLGMAVHIHSFNGVGNYYSAAGCDPLLLEPVFNDPDLRDTKFVIVHGGGLFWPHTSAMLWKPNVYTDISLLTQLWPPEQLATVLKDWLSQFPEKVLFGTDAVAFGGALSWEMSAWIASSSGRKALSIALSDMVKANEINIGRAKEIATMVMRTNASNLYRLGLK